MVERGTENPCVRGSTPFLGTIVLLIKVCFVSRGLSICVKKRWKQQEETFALQKAVYDSLPRHFLFDNN